ncbi:UNVERIFIED_ORG: hypothetical protein GGI66_003672 [Rhizobium esperanzae]
MSLIDEMTKQFGAAALTKPMSRGEAYQLLDALKSVLLEHQARLDAMESHGVRYCGVYQKALSYRRGDVVTASSSMWTALRDTAEGEQPGKALDAWQLSAKAARPAVPVKTERQE